MKKTSSFSSSVAICAALLGLIVIAGCGKTPPPSFRENVLLVMELETPTDQQQAVANALDALYGTPDEPYVLPDTGLSLKKIKVAAGKVRTDALGRDEGLYRRHCAHCHGVTGDGMGPTAAILNPYPRDYRQGKFKFKSTERAAKPTTEDLELILKNGVPGTAMPSFVLLPQDEIDALIEYVKYLSLRGETEEKLLRACYELSDDEKLPTDRAFLVEQVLAEVVEPWKAANESVIAPPERGEPDPESIAAGRELFYGTKAGCVKCHGVTALGDGQTDGYDDWSNAVFLFTKKLDDTRESLKSDEAEAKPAEGEETEKPPVDELARINRQLEILHADTLTPRNAIPRNLRLGTYRGGRRPLDIFRRIHAGIVGTPMPGVGPTAPGAEGVLSPEDIWHLVDYIRSLPYEPMSEPPPSGAVTAARDRL